MVRLKIILWYFYLFKLVTHALSEKIAQVNTVYYHLSQQSSCIKTAQSAIEDIQLSEQLTTHICTGTKSGKIRPFKCRPMQSMWKISKIPAYVENPYHLNLFSESVSNRCQIIIYGFFP